MPETLEIEQPGRSADGAEPQQPPWRKFIEDYKRTLAVASCGVLVIVLLWCVGAFGGPTPSPFPSPSPDDTGKPSYKPTQQWKDVLNEKAFDGAIFMGPSLPDTDSLAATMGAVELFGGIKAQSCTVDGDGCLDRETLWLLSNFDVKSDGVPKNLWPLIQNGDDDKHLVLIGFNAPSDAPQAPPDGHYPVLVKSDGSTWNSPPVVGIIDRHKLNIPGAGLTSQRPESKLENLPDLTLHTEPWGSVSSMVAWMFKERNITPKRHIAGMLLGGILSETYNLRSPTTSAQDVQMAKFLQPFAGMVSIIYLYEQQAQAKSGGITDGDTLKDLFTARLRTYEATTKVLVALGTVEAYGPDNYNNVLSRSPSDIKEALMDIQNELKLDDRFKNYKLILLYVWLIDTKLLKSTLIMPPGTSGRQGNAECVAVNGIMNVPTLKPAEMECRELCRHTSCKPRGEGFPKNLQAGELERYVKVDVGNCVSRTGQIERFLVESAKNNMNYQCERPTNERTFFEFV